MSDFNPMTDCTVCGDKIGPIVRTCQKCGFYFHSIVCGDISSNDSDDGKLLCKKCRNNLCSMPLCQEDLAKKCWWCKRDFCLFHFTGDSECDLCYERRTGNKPNK
jgi:hypothetical protein